MELKKIRRISLIFVVTEYKLSKMSLELKKRRQGEINTLKSAKRNLTFL